MSATRPFPRSAEIIHAALEWAAPPHGSALEARAVEVLATVNIDVWRCLAHVVREREVAGLPPADFACRELVANGIVRAVKRCYGV